MKILHVVRRYGDVGGMERYVWELSRAQAAQGHQVVVVCEQCLSLPPDIMVHQLGCVRPRPRWLALLRFSRRVAAWLQTYPQPGYLIHSHERLDAHQITTFHGPPFATVRDKPWWRKISLRVAMQLYLERRELTVAQAIVPNSAHIQQQLAHYYPALIGKLTVPVTPGVPAMPLRLPRRVPAQGGVIGFVGHEWKRKGLPLAIKIVAALRRTRPELELRVVGAPPEAVRPLFDSWPEGYRLLGWRSDQDYWREFDVLLHPAQAEPYGMVIAEALAAQVPVVVSAVCGAAMEVTQAHGSVLRLDASLEDWCLAVERQLQRADSPPPFQRDWYEVARDYEKIYQNLTVTNHE